MPVELLARLLQAYFLARTRERNSDRNLYRVTSEARDVDVDAVHAYLTRSYWACGISKALVARSIRTSLCFSLLHADEQIGFARIVTDRTTFAYLCDVYVLDAYRGQGLGKELLEAVVAHRDLQGLRRFVLATRDAHALFARYGFTPLGKPEHYMELEIASMYRTAREH